MTVNERIAKAVGWKVNPYPALALIFSDQMINPEGGNIEVIPDFDSNLDAMAIAEATLTDEQRYRYAYELACVLQLDIRGEPICSHLWKVATATAGQRAAAFLAAIEPCEAEYIAEMNRKSKPTV